MARPFKELRDKMSPEARDRVEKRVNETLLEMSLAEAAVTAAGFEIVGRSELLRNPHDDHTKSVFDPAIRGQTDRFLLRLRKPLE